MSLFNAVVDGRRIRLPNIARELILDVQNVQFTGTGSVKFANMSQVDEVLVTLVTGTAPGVQTSLITYTVSGNTVDLFAWMPTSSTNPTLIAGTNAVTATVVAFGRRRGGQNI